MTTFAELQTQIRDYTEATTDVLTDVIVNDFIEHAEDRIFRSIELDAYKGYELSNNTQSGNPFVSLPGSGIGTTATIRWATIYVDSGDRTRYNLERKDLSFIAEYYPTRTTGSSIMPKYYGYWEPNKIIIAPTPNTAYKVELAITKLPTGVKTSTDNPSSSAGAGNWVSLNAPRVLLYACLCEAWKFLKAPEQLQVYETSFQEALQALAQEQLGKRKRDEYRDGGLRVALPSNNP